MLSTSAERLDGRGDDVVKRNGLEREENIN